MELLFECDLLRRVPVMFFSRKLPAFVLLASYLFAVTVAERFHNHGDMCGAGACGHSEAGAGYGHRHAHAHTHGHAHHHAHHHARQGAEARDDRPAGSEWHATAHCAVCDFLAQLPLPAAPAVLVTCGRTPPQVVVLQDSQCSGWLRTAHLPRGPPVVA